MNTSFRFSKYRLHHRPLFYENFIAALLTQPVLEYVLDGMPLIVTLLENDLPPTRTHTHSHTHTHTHTHKILPRFIFNGYFQIMNESVKRQPLKYTLESLPNKMAA